MRQKFIGRTDTRNTYARDVKEEEILTALTVSGPGERWQAFRQFPALLLSLLLYLPASYPLLAGGGQELGMVAACFLLNLWPDLSLCKIQPIYIPFMLHKEMRQGSAVAHTYLKYFLFFFLRVVFTFSLKQGKKLAALKLAPLLYSLFLLI